jgi:hypothetical protein
MQKHIAIVEPCEGYMEFLSDELEERKSAQGLELPVEEIADRLDCRITILHWRNWFHYEVKETWDWTPAARPTSQPEFSERTSVFKSQRGKRIPTPAKNPVYGLPIKEKGLSPRSPGWINDRGLLFPLSCCLTKKLREFYNGDPFQGIVGPMWSGTGYVSQMARATGAGNLVGVAFVVEVTDTSSHRQVSNEEGCRTRHAIIRR